MPQLSKQDLANGDTAVSAYRNFDGIVQSRIKEIIVLICNCYKASTKDMWWDYSGDDPDYGDGGGGTLFKHWDGKIISIVVGGVGDQKIGVEEWPEELIDIPKAWLLLPDADIEAEVLKFIKSIKDEEAAKALKALTKKAKDKTLKQQALSKLTPEEKKALKLK